MPAQVGPVVIVLYSHVCARRNMITRWCRL